MGVNQNGCAVYIEVGFDFYENSWIVVFCIYNFLSWSYMFGAWFYMLPPKKRGVWDRPLYLQYYETYSRLPGDLPIPLPRDAWLLPAMGCSAVAGAVLANHLGWEKLTEVLLQQRDPWRIPKQVTVATESPYCLGFDLGARKFDGFYNWWRKQSSNK